MLQKTKPPSKDWAARGDGVFAGTDPSRFNPKPTVVQPETSEAIVVVFLGEPVAKARARVTKRGTAYTPTRTRNFERALGYTARAVMGARPRLTGPVSLTVEIVLAVPKSWPARKRLAAISGCLQPTSKPDIDNFAKAASDAISGIVIHDDAQVVALSATKAYGESPQIRITIEPLDPRRS